MRLLPVKDKDQECWTVVDDIDYLWAQEYNWHLSNGYVARNQRRGVPGLLPTDRKAVRMFLHREILGLKHGRRDVVVDHIDGDPLINVRSNLRVASYAENAHNRRDRLDGTSRYRGVSWWTSKGGRGCWRVQCMVDGKRTFVGHFDDEDEAGAAALAFYAEHMPLYAAQSQGEAQPSAAKG